MLGDFITKALVLLFGYTYPAFECFKTVEKNRADIENLRFWCQYWIIVAIITVFEKVGDVFISWLPMYGEAKLAFIIYLWHPKTRGTTYVYETFLKPYVVQHETDIDRRLLEVRARALDMAVLYWKNIAEQGQTKFFEALRYLASQSHRASPVSSEYNNVVTLELTLQHREGKSSPPEMPPPPPSRKRSPLPRLLTRRSGLQSPIGNPVYEAPPETGTVEENIVRAAPRWGRGGGRLPGSPLTPRSMCTGAKFSNKHMREEGNESLRAARYKLRRARRPD